MIGTKKVTESQHKWQSKQECVSSVQDHWCYKDWSSEDKAVTVIDRSEKRVDSLDQNLTWIILLCKEEDVWQT